MRIAVVHTTRYRYSSPVYLEPHTFRLRPREDGAQRLLRHRLEVSPQPAGSSLCLDAEGNVVLEAWFNGLTPELSVRTGFEVETLRENPFDFLLLTSGAELPLPAPPSALAHFAAGPVPETVRDWAYGIAQEAGRATVRFLPALNQALYQGFGHVVRDEGSPLAAEETLARREGSCRDLAVLFCAACRALRIPTRFVSGYEREASLQERAYLHAWAEVHLPGGGWRGWDPSQGLAVSTSHVAVAAAADPAHAAPVLGSYRGAAGSKMEFEIAMQVGPAEG